MKGTHGTCGTYAKNIQRQGFLSKIGRAGKGIYFWACNDDKESLEYATALAMAWWDLSKNKRNTYSRCPDKSCSVIYVKLTTNEGMFIDLESHEFKLKKTMWINRTYERLNKIDDNHNLSLSNAHDLYIQWLEEDLNEKIDIYYVNINPPPDFKYPIPFEIRGWPGCYIVKDSKCINILDIKKLENKNEATK